MTDRITRIAYLNSLDKNKKPFDLLLEIIEIECYQYNFDRLGIITSDGKSIVDIMMDTYSIDIEEYILKKWVENKFKLENGKLKLCSSDNNLDDKVQQINSGEKQFLEQVSKIREDFKQYFSVEFYVPYSKEQIKEIFNSYLYTVSKDKNIDTKDTKDYFIFQNYLSYLFRTDRKKLEIIENFGIANQIQDLILNDETDNPDFLKECIIFLDTPIIIKRLGYDGIELSDIYKKFFEDLKKAGAKLKIFEHTFEELWGILFNFKRCVAQNIFDAKGVDTFLKARKDFMEKRKEELSLVKENVRDNIRNIDIEVFDISEDDDIENSADFSEWNFDESLLRSQLISEVKSYEKFKTRLDKDIQSISAVSRLRKRNNISRINTFADGKFYLLVDNYALIRAIKAYYIQKGKKNEKNELLLENTIMFNLWQNLTDNNNLNRTLFISKCLALNTIDETFKDSLYREARKLEAYNSDIEINQQIINDPFLENDVYAESIKNNNFDKEYIEKILVNTVEKKQNELVNKHKEELRQKDNVIQQKVEFFSNELEKQRLNAQIDKEEYLEKYKRNLINRKIEELKKNRIVKFQFFFKKLFKKIDEQEFLQKEACDILGVEF